VIADGLAVWRQTGPLLGERAVELSDSLSGRERFGAWPSQSAITVANLALMSNGSKVVATVSTEAEAEMVCEALSEAGIRSNSQMSGGSIGLGAAASRDVYVEEQDYETALAVLNAAVPSEEELTRLSDEAGEGSAP
jgi:hypothetical protein